MYFESGIVIFGLFNDLAGLETNMFTVARNRNYEEIERKNSVQSFLMSDPL